MTVVTSMLEVHGDVVSAAPRGGPAFVDSSRARSERYGEQVARPDQPPETRTFEVIAWPADRRLVVYVPAIEASTTVNHYTAAEDAARELIADLTGLDPKTITCHVRLGPRTVQPPYA